VNRFSVASLLIIHIHFPLTPALPGERVKLRHDFWISLIANSIHGSDFHGFQNWRQAGRLSYEASL
jgi:hypothetical protein